MSGLKIEVLNFEDPVIMSSPGDLVFKQLGLNSGGVSWDIFYTAFKGRYAPKKPLDQDSFEDWIATAYTVLPESLDATIFYSFSQEGKTLTLKHLNHIQEAIKMHSNIKSSILFNLRSGSDVSDGTNKENTCIKRPPLESPNPVIASSPGQKSKLSSLNGDDNFQYDLFGGDSPLSILNSDVLKNKKRGSRSQTRRLGIKLNYMGKSLTTSKIFPIEKTPGADKFVDMVAIQVEKVEFDNWINEWEEKINIDNFLQILANLYQNIVFQVKGLKLAHRFVGNKLSIGKDEYLKAINGNALDLFVSEFILADKVEVIHELKLRGVHAGFEKFPLAGAADMGYSDIVRILARSEYVHAQLPVSIKRKRRKMINGENTPSNCLGMTALHMAIYSDSIACCEVILEYGLPKYDDKSGTLPPLYLAIILGSVAICELLVKHKAPINSPYDGTVPLYLATDLKMSAIVRMLLNYNANVNAVGADKWTVLHGAAASGDVEMIMLFIELGCNIEAINDEGSTTLDIAVKCQNRDASLVLLEFGASMNSSDINGWTPLHSTCWKGNLDICADLVEKGCDILAVNKDGRLPLHVAAFNNFPKICTYLVLNGAPLESSDLQEMTPLSLAAGAGNLKAVEALLKAGANVNRLVKNPLDPKQSISALQLAIIKKKKKVYMYLMTVPGIIVDSISADFFIGSKHGQKTLPANILETATENDCSSEEEELPNEFESEPIFNPSDSMENNLLSEHLPEDNDFCFF